MTTIMNSIRLIVYHLMTLPLSVALSAEPATFEGLGFFASRTCSSSIAYAISADGSTVIGLTNSPGCVYLGYRWTAATGMVALGTPDAVPFFVPDALSADGSAIVGGLVTGWGVDQVAARWTAASGVVPQGLPGGNWASSSFAQGVSGDGEIMVGEGSGWAPSCDGWHPNTEFQSFIQASSGAQLHDLHALDGYGGSIATAVSSDGSTAVGFSLDWDCADPHYPDQACLWRLDQGSMRPDSLGYLVNIGSASSAHAVSADGSVIVGQSRNWDGYRPFRWTADGGMSDLGELPGGQTNGNALAVSADGSVVVGYSGVSGSTAFLWDGVHGIRNLQTVLAELGLNLGDWTLLEATGVSADGRTIVGNGINPTGQQEAWIAFLGDPLPPCPGDLNNDESVDLGDLATLLAHFGMTSGATHDDGDLDGDGDVDLGDLTALLANYGTTCP